MQVRGWMPYVSTFSAFLSRAYDFVRMAAISRANLTLSGSHAGVSIGEDGPSQMALEDIASLRAIHGSTVLHPSDANQTAKLVALMADREGISFLRTLRGKTPVRTAPDEVVSIGGSRIAHEGDDVAIMACGITLDEAVKAAEQLADDGVSARVLDCYSIKPIDAEAVRAAARECGAIVTVEDHWPEGGLGDAVLEALAEGDEHAHVVKLAVREMPGSGSPEELLHGREDRRRGDRRRGDRSWSPLRSKTGAAPPDPPLSIVQLGFQVFPSSNEKAWSQRAESASISDQSKRIRIGMPSRTSAVSKRALVPSSLKRPCTGGSSLPGREVEDHQIRHVSVSGSCRRSENPS